MSYPNGLADYAPPPERLGVGLAAGIGAASAGAVAVGVFSGVTGIQSAYAAILLGWIVGLAVSRAGRDPIATAGAAVLSLAGSGAASVIAVCITAVREGHVPASIVAAHFWRAIPLLPQVIGWFGFVCWALAIVVSCRTVRSRGRMRSRTGSTATL